MAMDALTAFFLGQLSVVILFFAFIKFFIFGEPPQQQSSRPRTSSFLIHTPRLRKKRSVLQRTAPPPILPSTILSKTYYNVSGHQPESLDWFNVLIAQTLAQLRAEALHDDALLRLLNSVLNGSAKPDFVGPITVSELALGEEFPIFSNCRIIPVDEAGLEVKSVGAATRLLARLDMDLSDAITLGVETKLILNYPFPASAVLPVALAVSVVRFSGTLSLSFVPSSTATEPISSDIESTSQNGNPPSPTGPGPTTLAFSFLPDYRLDLSVRSLMGTRSRLQDVPKIAQLVEARIHAWLDDRCVEPRYQEIVLPSLWPRKKNTRGGDEAIEDDEDDEFTEAGADRHSETPTSRRDRPHASSLEERMAIEGRKLLASEERTSDGETLRRRPLRQVSSHENLNIPGQFV